MGTFNTKKILYGNPTLIPTIADRICDEFMVDGYEIKKDDLLNGGIEISVSKGGAFKAVLGMKTALKISLIPNGNNSILFDAGVGIFGQQVIPTIIMYFISWPVLITQIWGLVKQSKLDDKALDCANAVIATAQNININNSTSTAQPSKKFCTSCGKEMPIEARFCSHCGSAVS